MTKTTKVGALAGSRPFRIVAGVLTAFIAAAITSIVWTALSNPTGENLRGMLVVAALAGTFVGSQVSINLADRGQHPGTNSY